MSAAGGRLLALKLILGFFVLLLAAGQFLRPVADPDVFWHLRTGSWIWEHKALPGAYLFTFTAPAAMDLVQHLSMTSYWLFQVVLSLCFAAGGWHGVLVLRFALTAAFLRVLAPRRRGDDVILLGLLALAVVVLRNYYFERPQVISFICFALLVDQLERLRRDLAEDGAVPLRRMAALPLLMVVWANSHGGHVVGQGVIALTLAVEAARHLHPALGGLPWSRYRLLLAAGALGLLASLANPSTYHVFQAALLPSWATAFNREYLSTVAIFRESGALEVVAYWSLLGLAVLGTLLSASRPDPLRIALLAFTGFLSFTQVRHMAFLVAIAVPIALESLSRERFRAAGRALVLAPAVLIGLMVVKEDWRDLEGRQAPFEVESPLYPTDAAAFLETAGIEGRMFNFYGWGGYLLWRLAPTEVFIDGRNSDRELFERYQALQNGAALPPVGGVPAWKGILDSYGIRYTVAPFYDQFSGTVLPLVLDLLVPDPDWIPVFIGRNSIVHVERTPGNRAVIERHAIPRERVLPALLERCERLIRAAPDDPYPRIAKADLLIRLGLLAEARASLARAEAVIPAHPGLQARLAWLRRLGVE